MTTVYHICRSDEWSNAQASGVYTGSSQDHPDGFIHFSTQETVAESAATHRAGQTNLVLLAVESEPLGEALKWEKSRSGRLFPHLYASLPLTAVLWAQVLPLDPTTGLHVFPPL